MVDFTKLKVRTPEERALEEANEKTARIDEIRRKRQDLSKKSVSITLTEVNTRRTAADDIIIALWGKDEHQRDVRASYWYVEELDGTQHQILDILFDRIERKTKVELHGYWKKRVSKNQNGHEVVSWEFQTQKITLPDR